MKLSAISALVFMVLNFSFAARAEGPVPQGDLEKIFQRNHMVGTFALYDPTTDKMILAFPKRAKERRIPASTFKITNALIALETKVVADENEIIPYGGQPQIIKSWERDMSIRDGIKISNVPVFQELARRIGVEQYKDWLAKLHYGNGEIGTNVETFWLNGPLKISAVEQVQFLSQLAEMKLPLSLRSQKIVADIIKLESKNGRVLYGKTGWSSAPSPQIGWFVGWVESDRGTFPFALNMDILNNRDAKMRKRLVKLFLEKLDIY